MGQREGKKGGRGRAGWLKSACAAASASLLLILVDPGDAGTSLSSISPKYSLFTGDGTGGPCLPCPEHMQPPDYLLHPFIYYLLRQSQPTHPPALATQPIHSRTFAGVHPHHPRHGPSHPSQPASQSPVLLALFRTHPIPAYSPSDAAPTTAHRAAHACACASMYAKHTQTALASVPACRRPTRASRLRPSRLLSPSNLRSTPAKVAKIPLSAAPLTQTQSWHWLQ